MEKPENYELKLKETASELFRLKMSLFAELALAFQLPGADKAILNGPNNETSTNSCLEEVLRISQLSPEACLKALVAKV